jgi:UDP-N-acetylglucosamine acyltransferase
VGDGVLVMCGAHVAHDCELGDGVVLCNGVQLAGHVVCEPHALLGGLAAVAQYLRVGEGAFVAAGARVEADVPPYHIVQGDRARVRGLNTVGLARRGAPEAVVRALLELHRRLYRRGLPLATALGDTSAPEDAPREVRHLLAFLRETLTAPRRRTRALEVPSVGGVALAAAPAVQGGPREPGSSRGGDDPP